VILSWLSSTSVYISRVRQSTGVAVCYLGAAHSPDPPNTGSINNQNALLSLSADERDYVAKAQNPNGRAAPLIHAVAIPVLPRPASE